MYITLGRVNSFKWQYSTEKKFRCFFIAFEAYLQGISVLVKKCHRAYIELIYKFERFCDNLDYIFKFLIKILKKKWSPI